MTKQFDTHTRISVQILESNLDEDTVNAVKEYVNPMVKTALLITPPLGMHNHTYSTTYIHKLRNELSFTRTELEKVQECLRQQDIIRIEEEQKKESFISYY